MKNRNQIEDVKESTLITDDAGLRRFMAIVTSHETFSISMPKVGHIATLSLDSLRHIANLANINIPEHILFANRYRSNNANYEEEDSFMQNYRQKQKSNAVIDTEDIVQFSSSKFGNTNESNSNTLANSNDIEQNILDSMKNKTFFEKNIKFFLFIWELCYDLLLLTGVIFFCHLSFVVFTANGLISLYMILGSIINGLLFVCGFSGLYYIKIEKIKKVNETPLNILLGVLLGFTVATFILIEYVSDETPLGVYLIERTLFFWIYVWLMIICVSGFVMNFKINQFYVEYNYLLPLKVPLMSERIIEFIDDRDN